jgi:succinate-acetate transporter protein
LQHPNVIVGMALGFGGLAQLLAGMWEVSLAALVRPAAWIRRAFD